jgi:hypothetical protein
VEQFSQILIYPECPFQFLFGCARGCDIDGQQELLEIDEPGIVGVECSENMLTKAFSRTRREKVLKKLIAI